MKLSMTPPLIAAGLMALVTPAVAQEAEDFTARLNRLPVQATEPAPEAEAEPPAEAPPPEVADEEEPDPPQAAPQADPEPEPEAEAEAEPESEPVAEAPDAEAAGDPVMEAEPSDEDGVEAAVEDTDAAEAVPPPPEPVVLDSQDGLAFRVQLPAGFQLLERPSGPDFDVYQVAREGTPFVGVYVGCCSPFPIYDGRRAQAGGRESVLVQEDGSNRAVEHLFIRESDGRQIHVWLHSVAGEDRALAEAIAQTVDPR